MNFLPNRFRLPNLSAGLLVVLLWFGSDVSGQTPRIIESRPQTDPAPVPAEETIPTPATPPPIRSKLPSAADSWPKDVNEISVDIRQTEFDVPDRWAEFCKQIRQRPLRVPQWKPLQFSWQATELWHRPLYFDDVPLERYGQMHHPLVQPVYSAAHFFGNVPLLPYKMGLDPPNKQIATLGYYRPGSAAPPVGRRLPLEADAATIEAATWVGLILLLP